jgi:GAF domain-containing protein/HAMP domain-containing protein
MAVKNPTTTKLSVTARVLPFARGRSLSRRLLANTIVSVLAVLFILSVILFNAFSIYQTIQTFFENTANEIELLNDINGAVQVSLSKVREFTYLEDPSVLPEIQDNLLLAQEITASLIDSTSGNKNENFQKLQRDLDKLESQTTNIIYLIRSNPTDISGTTAALLDLRNTEQELADTIGAVFSILRIESDELIITLSNRIQRTLVTLFIGSVTFLVAILFVNRVTIFSILQPIRDLVEVTQRITGGETDLTADDRFSDEIGTLANAFNQMNAQQRALISSEEEISRRLQENLNQLQASTEVAQVVASILDPQEISERVVNLIQEAFGLYYVGLFTPDERDEWAVLRTGTGEAGQMMLARRHRIKIGEGMIGWCIEHAEPRVAQVVGEDDLRLATEELPETRAEAAIPLRSRGNVVGALTVQDRQPNIFDEQMMSVLQNMADQVAIALDNARLFAESEEALDSARRAYTEISREAWGEYLEAQQDINYLATPQVESRLQASDWAPEMAETYTVGEITRHGEDTIHIPIILRDQTLGVVRLRKQAGTGTWTDDEIQLMDTIVDQLETALETARLYSSTQIQAERERLTHEVTDKLHRSYDMDTLMQTLLQEISSALGASSAYVQLSSDLAAPESAISNPISKN